MRFSPLALLLLSSAGAQSLAQARHDLDQGQWQRAAQSAAALYSSEGDALAAEALTFGAGTVPASARPDLFQKAEALARRAVAANPNNADAYFRLGVALGRKAQEAELFTAVGLAQEIKRNLEKAIALDPQSAPPLVALGIWNATVAAKGTLAALATGASRSAVMPLFAKAFAIEPRNPSVRLEYAHALLLLSPTGNREAAKRQLAAALTMPAKTYWDAQNVEAARDLLKQLQAR